MITTTKNSKQNSSAGRKHHQTVTLHTNLGDSGHAEQVGQRGQEAEYVQQTSVVQVAEHSGPRRKPLSMHGSRVNMASGQKRKSSTRSAVRPRA